MGDLRAPLQLATAAPSDAVNWVRWCAIGPLLVPCLMRWSSAPAGIAKRADLPYEGLAEGLVSAAGPQRRVITA